MKTFEISQEQAQTLANYLATKPFNEVVGFIQMLTTLKIINPGDDVLGAQAEINKLQAVLDKMTKEKTEA